jgi:23S rRNA (cytidine1920-2'-O)/16S rRNA (cytidine1409-2'-O)-methyltransferase
VVLIKPQFEAGRRDVRRGKGVIRDGQVHRQVLLDVLSFAQSLGLEPRGLIKSPLFGPKGNAEFLAWLAPEQGGSPLEALVGAVVPTEFGPGIPDP